MSVPARNRLAEGLIVVALMMSPLLFFWRVITPNIADRATFPTGDFTHQYYPLRAGAAEEMAQGRFPLWNPYVYGGQPGLADSQVAALYPINALTVLLLGGRSFGLLILELQVIFHFCLVALFTYLLARRLTGSRLGGAVAALGFTFGGYLTSFPIQQPTILETAVWLPLILLLLDQGLTGFWRGNGGGSRHVLPFVMAGLALGVSLLAGHPQTFLYVLYTSILYFAYGACRSWRERETQEPSIRRGVLKGLGALAIFGVTGMAISAAQWMPTWEFLRLSTRAELSYEFVSGGFELHELTHLLFPGYFGGSPQYVGILPLLLALMALAFNRSHPKRLFWGGLGLLALFLAFGRNTFVFDVFYLLVPGFGWVRNQERIIFLFGFSVAILSGYGAAYLMKSLSEREHRLLEKLGRGLGWAWLAALGLLFILVFGAVRSQEAGVEVNLFAGLVRHQVFILILLGLTLLLFHLRLRTRAGRRIVVALMVFIVVWNLFTINWRYNLQDGTAGSLFPRSSAITFLQDQGEKLGEPFRVSSAGLLPGTNNAGLLYGLEDITGNTPLQLASFRQFEDNVDEWQRWQLLDVRYVLDQRDLEGGGLHQVHEDGEVRVYEMLDPFPRAWVVHDARAVGSFEEMWVVLNAADVDLRETVAIYEASPLALPGRGVRGSTARIIDYGPDRMIVEVDSIADGLLVLSQVRYPGWRARVDGREVPILAADHVLMAVPVGGGSHRIEVTYDPGTFRLGLIVSGGAALAIVGFLIGVFITRSRASNRNHHDRERG